MIVEIINEKSFLYKMQYEVVKETSIHYHIRLHSGAITTVFKDDCKIVEEEK